MASNGSPIEEYGYNEVKKRKWGKEKGRPRHKFTKDELHILNLAFEENPYPDFTTRKELAEQLHCQVYVIDNWYQNKRARLPPRERHIIFAARKRHEFPVQHHLLLSLQDAPAESPLLGKVGCSPETWRVPSQQDGSADTDSRH
ncbi:cytoplasmic polyadenylated homeobox-like protein [Manis javanica]|uniref:cytoplasmic polyadenylated homeobox-like protein n=1 Tax=Manis javanica TaxID=9974 RepID=UPI000813B990|nr:cytoplasmic polyadenylated homeobox-like [Manis javanica]